MGELAVEEVPPAAKKITYVLFIFSRAEMARPSTKREPKQSSMAHGPDIPWDTIKAQILVRVAESLKPDSLHFSNYSITATIARLIPKPGLPLTNEAEYANILERISKYNSSFPTVNLSVTENTSTCQTKENVPANGEIRESGGKKKQKVRHGFLVRYNITHLNPFSQSDPADLPGNQSKLRNIQQLKERWVCDKGTDSCVGNACYVGPDGKHMALSHEMLDCWASAMVCLKALLVFWLARADSLCCNTRPSNSG